MAIDATPAFPADVRHDAEARPSGVQRLLDRARKLLADRSDTAVAQKVAGSAFLIRVVNAAIAFASQILLARWMGETEYGIYVYVWTWVLLLGGTTSLGLGSAPQRFIPEYAEGGHHALLRGFLFGSRLMAVAFATGIAGAGMLGLWLLGDYMEHWALIPLYLALICVPMYVLTDVQDGIARSHNWIDVALAPAYFVRPLLILGLLAALSVLDYAPTAVTAMAATIFATWVTAIVQLVLLSRRLKARVEAGPREFDPKTWMKVSLPIFMVEGFYLLLAYTDVIVLSAFREPQEVGIYYAAVKVMSLVAFVSFSVSAAVAHRFTEYAMAGEKERLATMVRDAARWTFWPSLAGACVLLAVGWPMLWLFGEAFTAGYPLLFVIAIGLLARAVVGPLERLLNMLGQQNICAAVYGGAFVLNVVLAVSLVPSLGTMGAAIATSITLTVESILLFWVTRKRLGLGALPWGRTPSGGGEQAAAVRRDAVNLTAFDAAFTAAPAAAPARPLGDGSTFSVMSLDEISALRPAWLDLASRAAEPNLFCEADFAMAAGSRLKAARSVRFVVVHDPLDRSRLLAVVPVAVRKSMPFRRMLTSTQWAFFGALGTPLIDGERAVEAVEGLLDGFASRGESLFLFRFLHEDGPAAEAIRTALANSGRAMVRIDGHARAILKPADATADAYLTASLSSKKLKELRRQLRRLADDAPVAFHEARGMAGVTAALERFLDLEARGWKGENGSSLKSRADHLSFIRNLAANLAATGQIRILELTVGDDTVAAGMVLTSGRQAWFYKIAYDERYARCSPGVQLTLELTKRLIEDPEIDAVDSTAIADHPMIDHIWRERLPLGDWMIAARPGAAPQLALAAAGERYRRRARTVVRDLYHRVKERAR